MKKIRAKKFIPGLFTSCYRKPMYKTGKKNTRKLRR
jgi:hypothetical protein